MKCRGSKPGVLTFLDLTTIGIGNSLGVGIFVLLGELTGKVAGPAVVVSIIISGLTAILISLCHAEFGTRFVKADTAYSYSYLYHGENVAFVFGWALLLEFIAGSASVAKGIITFIDALTEYEITNFLKNIVPLKPDLGFSYIDFFSPIVIVVLMIFLLCGLKESIVLRNVLTSGTVVLILTVIVAGSFKADLSNWDVARSNSTNFEKTFAPFGYMGILKGAALSFYGFIGLDTMSVTGKEMKNPQILVPFANSVSACVIVVLYAGVAVVLTLMTPHWEHVVGAALPFVFEQVNWIFLKWIVAAGAFFGFAMSLLGLTFPLSRLINAMANDGVFCRCLGNGYLSGKAPVAAIIFGGLLSAVCAGLVNFEILTRVTVIATLFSSTILAIDIIMLRYVPLTESTRIVSDVPIGSPVPKANASLHEFMRLFFRFTTDASIPTKLTEKIVKINMVLFCTASLGLAVIFIVFYDLLMLVAIEAIIPSVLLLAIMLISVASIMRQPKSIGPASFKVPLVPILPCLSIFLNLLLMTLLGFVTLVYFVIWMTAGILPYLFWFSIKYIKGDVGGNSLYEINKSNSVKLNESILKITSDKKSFYEGAINPVFQDDDGEEMFDESEKRKKFDGDTENRPDLAEEGERKENETVSKENDKSLEATKKEVDDLKGKSLSHPVVSEEEAQWKCIAEVHTEKESLEESYEFQMVDNTYDFLSDMAEDFTKDETTSQKSGNSSTSSAAEVFEKCSRGYYTASTPETTESPAVIFRKCFSEGSPPRRNSKRRSSSGRARQRTNSEGGAKTEEVARKPRKKTSSESSPFKKDKNNDDRAKAFKDKLNILLKNQMNMSDMFKESILRYEKDAEEAWVDANNDKKLEFSAKNIKTLNKSQMRDTLEILLAKGPPKRYSLRNSFNIKITETSIEDESKKS